jgi:hypothetical protein
MAGLRPGHPRLPRQMAKKDVDARLKAGHDDEGIGVFDFSQTS